jgi:hypothetical protein
MISRQRGKHTVLGGPYIFLIALLVGAALAALIYYIVSQLPPHYLLD